MSPDAKRILVVTGASSGMGREFLKQIEKQESAEEIWVIARRAEALEALRSEVKTPLVCLPLDLSDPASWEVYRERLEAEKPCIRVLANCAGYGFFDHTENLDAKQLTNMISLNCAAVVAMTQYSLPYFPQGGKIMNISSCASFQPIPYINDYAATKAFVTSYSRALSRELAYRKVRVLAITPFWTKTAFFDRAIAKDRKEVVIKYAAMYDPAKVMAKAIHDLYRTKKDISCYGFVNNAQRVLVRLLPVSLVMKIWMGQQKLNGTPQIR